MGKISAKQFLVFLILAIICHPTSRVHAGPKPKIRVLGRKTLSSKLAGVPTYWLQSKKPLKMRVSNLRKQDLHCQLYIHQWNKKKNKKKRVLVKINTKKYQKRIVLQATGNPFSYETRTDLTAFNPMPATIPIISKKQLIKFSIQGSFNPGVAIQCQAEAFETPSDDEPALMPTTATSPQPETSDEPALVPAQNDEPALMAPTQNDEPALVPTTSNEEPSLVPAANTVTEPTIAPIVGENDMAKKFDPSALKSIPLQAQAHLQSKSQLQPIYLSKIIQPQATAMVDVLTKAHTNTDAPTWPLAIQKSQDSHQPILIMGSSGFHKLLKQQAHIKETDVATPTVSSFVESSQSKTIKSWTISLDAGFLYGLGQVGLGAPAITMSTGILLKPIPITISLMGSFYQFQHSYNAYNDATSWDLILNTIPVGIDINWMILGRHQFSPVISVKGGYAIGMTDVDSMTETGGGFWAGAALGFRIPFTSDGSQAIGIDFNYWNSSITAGPLNNVNVGGLAIQLGWHGSVLDF